MARDLGLDGLLDHFTLICDEPDQLRKKAGATRPGFAVLLKFLLWRGRFPQGRHELPDDAVAHLARQVRVPAEELGSFDFASRTAKRHRTEIRATPASGSAASRTPRRWRRGWLSMSPQASAARSVSATS